MPAKQTQVISLCYIVFRTVEAISRAILGAIYRGPAVMIWGVDNISRRSYAALP